MFKSGDSLCQKLVSLRIFGKKNNKMVYSFYVNFNYIKRNRTISVVLVSVSVKRHLNYNGHFN